MFSSQTFQNEDQADSEVDENLSKVAHKYSPNYEQKQDKSLLAASDTRRLCGMFTKIQNLSGGLLLKLIIM